MVTYDNRVNVIAAAGSGKTQGIGKATGREPTVAPWLTEGSESQVLSEIVAELKGTAGRCRHGSAHGRVHRYRGHAVRKNVAATHRGNTRLVGGANPWPTMFELAAQERGERSEIFPDWVYPGSALIQRLVPLLPMSRGTQHYRRLIKTLGAYRLTLGQPLQEELIANAGEGADLALDLAP